MDASIVNWNSAEIEKWKISTNFPQHRTRVWCSARGNRQLNYKKQFEEMARCVKQIQFLFPMQFNFMQCGRSTQTSVRTHALAWHLLLTSSSQTEPKKERWHAVWQHEVWRTEIMIFSKDIPHTHTHTSLDGVQSKAHCEQLRSIRDFLPFEPLHTHTHHSSWTEPAAFHSLRLLH